MLGGEILLLVFVSADTKVLADAKENLQVILSDAESAHAACLAPEDLFVFLEGLDAQRQTKEQTVRGYKVNVEFKPVSESEKNARKQARGRTILQTMKRPRRN